MDYLAEHRIQRAIMTRNTLVDGVDVLLQQEKDGFSNISPDNFFSKVCMCKLVYNYAGLSLFVCVYCELGNNRTNIVCVCLTLQVLERT